MVQPFLRINAVTRANRDETIDRVRTAMSASGAWIVDVKLFSNVSVCFNFEVPTSQVKRLRDALTATDLHFTTDSAASFASAVDRKSADSQAADTAGSLQITFVHNEPDLRIEVPQIPG